MTSADDIDFAYFMEWGRSPWTRFFRQALLGDLGLDAIRDKSVLDIGTRDGRAASCFALLGARHVTGIDADDIDLSLARAEAQKHGVGDRVEFRHFDGALDDFADGQFDLVFTKSALVVATDLDAFVQSIGGKLADGGSVVFLENAKGGRLIEFLRGVRHRKWGYSRARMMTDAQVDVVKKHIDVMSVSKSRWPPVYKIVGRRKSGVGLAG